MNQGCLGAVGLQRRHCKDAAVVHDNGITLCVAAAGGIPKDTHVKLLVGIVAGDRAGDDIGAGPVTI